MGFKEVKGSNGSCDFVELSVRLLGVSIINADIVALTS